MMELKITITADKGLTKILDRITELLTANAGAPKVQTVQPEQATVPAPTATQIVQPEQAAATQAAQRAQAAVLAPTTVQTATVQQTVPVAVPVQQTTPAAPAAVSVQQTAQQPTAAVPTSAPAYTFDMIAQAGATLIDAGKMDALMGILGRYGVSSLTELPPAQYGAVATELRALGAKI